MPIEGEVPPAGAMGFAAGLMMKAHAAAEGVKEKASGINTGNIQVGHSFRRSQGDLNPYLSDYGHDLLE